MKHWKQKGACRPKGIWQVSACCGEMDDRRKVDDGRRGFVNGDDMATDAAFTLSTDEQGRLILERPEQERAVDVRVRRSFPWSRPDRHISIRSSEGKELVHVRSLDDLPMEQRRIVENWLAATSFIPRITRVLTVDMRFGYQQWSVETDRGPVEFRVQEREDVRFLGDGRFRLKDVDGNVYELVRLDELDEASRKKLEILL